jgi:cell division protein FtsZ
MFELEELLPETNGGSVASIKVVGVGGAGGNVINNMIASSITAVDYVAVNTDLQVLETSMATHKLQIGKNITRGLGAGSKPEVGKQSALEDRNVIAEYLAGADMVFITAGMGGGTGTGAAPVVAEIARDQGSLAVAVVTRPFFYEGGIRKRNAAEGIDELQKYVDTLIVIPNDRIGLVAERGTPLLESFSIANNVLRNAVKGITDLILVPGLINLDFADVKTVMETAGRSVIGMGVGRGEGAAHDAAKRAILNPLLENTSIDGASGVLINITGGLELSLDDVHEATGPIFDSADEGANIIMGAVVDPDLKDEVRVTIIATGFEDEPKRAELPNVKKWSAPKRIPAQSSTLRGADRVLAKSIFKENTTSLVPADEDPMDVPTFLRKPEHGAAEVVPEDVNRISSVNQ